MDSSVVTPPAPPHAPDAPASRPPAGAGGNGRGGLPGPLPPAEPLGPPPRRHHLWRALLGCLIVLLASAGATAVAVLEQVHTLVQDISVNVPLKVDSRVLARTSFGQPETLLMVGDDTRKVFKYYRGVVPDLANEMVLVRIDPSQPWISMLSLPRELWVPITAPNGLTTYNRLNSAYTYGTTTLLQTIKQLTGLSVNHVIATTFTQFQHAIDTLGCVYATVDERYYHNNANGGDQYQDVDLQPGYQCLDGNDAEQFVSYRHTDSSQIRDARDQSFLLAVKQQYGPQLAGHIGVFEKVFGQTVETDPGLRSSSEILNLANLLISAAGLRVRQVPFAAEPCPLPCPAGNLTATSEQIEQSVNDFLHGGGAAPTAQVAAIGHRIAHHGGLAQLPLTPTLSVNVAAEKEAAASLPFTAEFPRVQDLAGSAAVVVPQCGEVMQPCLRDYAIRAPDGAAYPIYVEVFSNGQLGQFYDVQGSTWTGAPLFAHPDQTLRVGRRTYELFYDGSTLQTVAWREFGAVYWIHNTLTNAVGNGELMAIAEQTAPVGPIRGAPPASPPRAGHGQPTALDLRDVGVPSRQLEPAATPVAVTVGRIGGLVALALIPLGLLALMVSRRRLRRLREEAEALAARAAGLESRLAHQARRAARAR